MKVRVLGSRIKLKLSAYVGHIPSKRYTQMLLVGIQNWVHRGGILTLPVEAQEAPESTSLKCPFLDPHTQRFWISFLQWGILISTPSPTETDTLILTITFKEQAKPECWWLMPVILGTWKAEMRILVQSQQGGGGEGRGTQQQ
jgi:hypothetical protein